MAADASTNKRIGRGEFSEGIAYGKETKDLYIISNNLFVGDNVLNNCTHTVTTCRSPRMMARASSLISSSG